MLDSDFESILKPVHKKYKDKMNQMKTEERCKTPYTEKINTHIRFGWYVQIMFSYGDVLDPLKIYCSSSTAQKMKKSLMENFAFCAMY